MIFRIDLWSTIRPRYGEMAATTTFMITSPVATPRREPPNSAARVLKKTPYE